MNELLIQSCIDYYNFLATNNKGIQDIKLVSHEIQNDIVTLNLQNKIFSLDCVVFQTPNISFSLDDENIIDRRYYEELKKIELHIQIPLLNEVKESLDNKTIKVYSDLKFLVNNLKNFFMEYNITLPTTKPKVTIQENQQTTNHQKQAIQGILNHNLSYVWGPPGSGKTQYVLFEAIMHYLNTNQKICVLAPTNNALEQILQTLLQRFDSCNIERTKLLRLGTPTTQFINNFPDVCDPYVIKQKNKVDLFNIQLTPKQRYDEARIFAMTVDGFIKKYPSLEIDFAHIFLDEAAFTPLIKTLALCTNNIPITLLGDHKQLSPICEMEEREMINEYKNIKLWNFSALYLEDFFTNPNFLETSTLNPPNFEKIQLYKLNTTYRYGNNLAKILDDYIYHINLQGTTKQTLISFVHAPSIPEDERLTSQNEADAIHRIYRELKNENIAILTPFNAQRLKIIQKGIPFQYVSTIHSSQGREFDTVILSPVMLHYHLTNSNNIEALYTLNVAISRLKKQLIIVCDYYFWLKQKNQFLCKLLEQAKPYKFKL